MERDDQRYEI
jgi:hypothetical protein